MEACEMALKENDCPDEVYQRLKKLEESQIRQEMLLQKIEADLKVVGENLKTLTDVQVEQVRAREETYKLFETTNAKADAAHRRLDRIDAHIQRVAWAIGLLFLGTIASTVGWHG